MPLGELYEHDTFKSANVSAKISLVRQSLGLTQAQLGEKMNPPIGRKRVSFLETQKKPQFDTIKRVANALGVDVSVFS